eukprot:GEZU01021486.1.p1 GENE.GEZU01021486.1~~GEZU01021486.1.p1  ORF type:complete len:193 (-),score=22.51 GEZU01021486.1:568-1146(-)
MDQLLAECIANSQSTSVSYERLCNDCFLIRNVLSREACAALLAEAERQHMFENSSISVQRGVDVDADLDNNPGMKLDDDSDQNPNGGTNSKTTETTYYYRKHDNIALESKEIADALWKKLEPFVRECVALENLLPPGEDQEHPKGSIMVREGEQLNMELRCTQGLWEPVGLTSKMEVFRYRPGIGVFAGTPL